MVMSDYLRKRAIWSHREFVNGISDNEDEKKEYCDVKGYIFFLHFLLGYTVLYQPAEKLNIKELNTVPLINHMQKQFKSFWPSGYCCWSRQRLYMYLCNYVIILINFSSIVIIVFFNSYCYCFLQSFSSIVILKCSANHIVHIYWTTIEKQCVP